MKKKNFVYGYSTTVYGAWGLEETQSALDPHRKKYIFVFGY